MSRAVLRDCTIRVRFYGPDGYIREFRWNPLRLQRMHSQYRRKSRGWRS